MIARWAGRLQRVISIRPTAAINLLRIGDNIGNNGWSWIHMEIAESQVFIMMLVRDMFLEFDEVSPAQQCHRSTS
jgi:hypothetical protein